MFKNVAAKFIVFAFDATTNVPKTGDAAQITAYVSKDYAAVTLLADTSATEMDATNAPGYYLFDAAQGETNGDILLVSGKSSTANIKVIGAPATIYTRPTTGWLAPATAGRTLVVDASGLADANMVKAGPTGSGTAQTAKDIGGAVPAVAAGAAGGILISGANSGTTTLGALTVTGVTTHTGNVVLSDGLTVSAPSAANRDGISITGKGTGHGIKVTGGASGDGGQFLAGASGARGFLMSGPNGLEIDGSGNAGHAAIFNAGTTNAFGISINGGVTSGDGINIATTSGHAINLAPAGSSKHGLLTTGGNAGTSDGIKAVAGTGGVDIRGNQTGNLVGTVSTLTTYTGNTPQTGDAFARLGAPAGASVSADIAAVNSKTTNLPAAPASTTNITSATGIDVTKWNGTNVSVPTTAGVPNVNAKTWNDLATVALPLVPTTAGRTLDVSATGEAGVDWANVGSPTTALDLSGTTIKTTQVVASVTGAVGSVTAPVSIAASQLFVKKNVQLVGFMFKMVLSATGLAATGKTIVCQRSINGAAFGNCANTPATEISDGWYKITLEAADLNGVLIAFKATEATCKQTDLLIVTQA